MDGSDDLVLDAYRLADRFKQNPEVFLAMPLSEIERHITRLAQLLETMAREQKRSREIEDDG